MFTNYSGMRVWARCHKVIGNQLKGKYTSFLFILLSLKGIFNLPVKEAFSWVHPFSASLKSRVCFSPCICILLKVIDWAKVERESI